MIKGIKLDTSQIPNIELRVLYAAVFDAAVRFYENPENAAGFKRWLMERERGKADGQENSDKA